MEDFEISNYLQNLDTKKRTGICIACEKPVQWSRDRVAAHKRTSCPNATVEEKRMFAKRKSEPSTSSQYQVNISDQSSNPNEPVALPEDLKKELDTKLANFFFRTGISLRLVESEAFKDLIRTLNPAYEKWIPSAKTLSGPLLDQKYAKCLTALEEILKSSGNLTLISDGWTNVRGDHIVNFCIKAPTEKPFFYTSINTSGIVQNASGVAGAIIEVIENLGPQKFSCVITDNANVMKSAWRLIEEKFPHISANGCAAHGINLLVKDILNTNETSKTIKDAEKIIKFVKNHHIVKAKFDEMRSAANHSRSLSMPVSTRWFSVFESMNDLQGLKYVLIQLADEENEILKEIHPKANSSVVLTLIKSNLFWDRLAKLVKDIEYPSNIIGKVESDDAPLSLVYHYFGEMYNKYENDKIIQGKVRKRLDFLFTSSVGLAYMLTPKYAADGFYFDEDKTDIISTASEYANKVAPTIADKVQDEMIAFIEEMSLLTEKRKETIYKMNAKQYWNIVGRQKYPAVFEVAQPIVEMICSSATAERTWSTFRFIHSRLRNRLTNERVKKLVFIYTNSVLMDTKDKNDYILEEGAVLSGVECEEMFSEQI